MNRIIGSYKKWLNRGLYNIKESFKIHIQQIILVISKF